MQRYLLNIAYIGTKYNGVTKNVNIKDHYSIECALRQAFEKIKNVHNVEISPSSRTDAGVHATNTTFHIDVNRDSPLPPWVITKKLNLKLSALREQIRILKTVPVSSEFDSRRVATCRTYLYRFAVCKEPVPKGMNPKIYHSSMFIPIEESFRCYFLLNEGFDIERVKDTAKQMEGVHDFRTFMKVSKEQKTLHPRFCLRRMDSITVQPGMTLATRFNYEKTLAHFDFWNIEFRCRAFFYRQIRNMVGVLLAVGNGKINQRDVYEMLTIPSKKSWNYQVPTAPSPGLYLTNVEYPQEVLAEHIRSFKEDEETTGNENSIDDDDDDDNDEIKIKKGPL
ncbi:tRNA pseudouridine synthase-like 1 isoform X2 [Sitodiplosis mosellana]|uniref:tRNA pseudouridine synthase-like 1 isoform X2 n=1 Tax=Sitodiplosis mosellana TaxID=263140 RepID=UPI0024446288|nr:tRNA pseudouridine synthase-like 1 isoform X2 [Sitodiplosis mosellana]